MTELMISCSSNASISPSCNERLVRVKKWSLSRKNILMRGETGKRKCQHLFCGEHKGGRSHRQDAALDLPERHIRFPIAKHPHHKLAERVFPSFSTLDSLSRPSANFCSFRKFFEHSTSGSQFMATTITNNGRAIAFNSDVCANGTQTNIAATMAQTWSNAWLARM